MSCRVESPCVAPFDWHARPCFNVIQLLEYEPSKRREEPRGGLATIVDDNDDGKHTSSSLLVESERNEPTEPNRTERDLFSAASIVQAALTVAAARRAQALGRVSGAILALRREPRAELV